MPLNRIFPIIQSLKEYDKSMFKGDLSAGLTVGIMLIPQSMAYAMLAGLPPIYGFYAAIVPLIIYALLGTSRQLAVGPSAMISILVAAGISSMAVAGTVQYIEFAIILSLMVGLIQVFLGVLRLGFIVNFLSHPVVSGFTSAAAIIIGISQLKHLLGINLSGGKHTFEVLLETMQRIPETNGISLSIGLVGILIILGIKRFKIPVPGSIVAVALSILAVWIFNLHKYDLAIVGDIPKGLPSLYIPTFEWATIQSLFPIALAISLVIFMQSVAIAKAMQSRHKNYKINPNQELYALGFANLFGSFFQAFPTTGGFARSAVNDEAGASSGVASIISASLIIITLLFLTPLFYFLPNAILGSIIMVAIINLFDYKEAKHLWKTHRTDFWTLAITFFATLILGIQEGIFVGVAISLIMILLKTSKPHIAELGKVPGTDLYRNLDRFEDVEKRADLFIMRFDAPLYFANIEYFKEQLENRISNRKTTDTSEALNTVILDMESVTDLDSSAAHGLREIIESLKAQHYDLYLTGVRGPVRDALVKNKLFHEIGSQNFFANVNEAVDFKDNPDANVNLNEKYILQTNVKAHDS